mgnify:CR=1 FL=1
MSQPKWLDKYLTMKPEVNKIFDDLDKYLDWCRINLEPYNPANLYKENTNWGKMMRFSGSYHRNGNNSNRFNNNGYKRKFYK